MHGPAAPLRVLLIDDDRQRRTRLLAALRASAESVVVTVAEQPKEILPVPAPSFDVAMLALPRDEEPLASVNRLAAHLPEVPIVTVGGDVDESTLPCLLSCGVQDHLAVQCASCPGSPRLALVLRWAVERRRLLARIEALQQESAHRAFHDPLTDLPNRRLFRDRLRFLLAQAARRGGLVGVMFVDLDRFKDVNDGLGHDAGDELLVAVARRLTASIRASDTCARWGGDEFTLALDGLRGAEEAIKIARKIRKALAAPYVIGAQVVRCSASIGISLYPLDGENEVTLMRKADSSMYRAKRGGGNSSRCFRGARRGLRGRPC